MKAHARVSVETLARETACSERSIRRALRTLETLGLLSRTSVDEFVLHVDALERMPRVTDAS